jgi:hypothetical protein
MTPNHDATRRFARAAILVSMNLAVAPGALPAPLIAQLTTGWVTRYGGVQPNWSAGARDLAIDAAGNVYVTGFHAANTALDDFATIKYDANGNQLWIATFNGTGNRYDHAVALVVDGAGNVYVTGWSQANVNHADYVTIKYDQNGAQLWTARHNSLANYDDRPVAIALDGAGNVYVTGRSGTATLRDYLTIKYSPTGTELWAVRHNPLYTDDVVHDMAVSAAGDVVVTGVTTIAGPASEFCTVKYDTNGNLVWDARFTGFGGAVVELDATGNVYVGGTSLGQRNDFTIVKYDASGVQQWATKVDGGLAHDDGLVDLVLDPAGNIYATGTGNWGAVYRRDYLTTKLDATGTQQWIARYDAGDQDAPRRIALTPTGVVVTGFASGDNSRDYVTAWYDADGTGLADVRYDGTGHSLDEAWGLAADATGAVYVTGESQGTPSSDWATIKYQYNGPGFVAGFFCLPWEDDPFGQRNFRDLFLCYIKFIIIVIIPIAPIIWYFRRRRPRQPATDGMVLTGP